MSEIPKPTSETGKHGWGRVVMIVQVVVVLVLAAYWVWWTEGALRSLATGLVDP